MYPWKSGHIYVKYLCIVVIFICVNMFKTIIPNRKNRILTFTIHLQKCIVFLYHTNGVKKGNIGVKKRQYWGKKRQYWGKKRQYWGKNKLIVNYLKLVFLLPQIWMCDYILWERKMEIVHMGSTTFQFKKYKKIVSIP